MDGVGQRHHALNGEVTTDVFETLFKEVEDAATGLASRCETPWREPSALKHSK